MVSDKQIEAVQWLLFEHDVDVELAQPILEAAARVREEANNECGEAAHPAPGEPYRETAFAGVPGGVVRLLQGGDCLSAYGAVQEVAGQ